MDKFMLSLGAEKATIDNFDFWFDLVKDSFKDKDVYEIFSDLELINKKTEFIYIIKKEVLNELYKKARKMNLINLLTKEQWAKAKNPIDLLFELSKLQEFIKTKKTYKLEQFMISILAIENLFKTGEYLTNCSVDKTNETKKGIAIKLVRDNEGTLGKFKKALEEIYETKASRNIYVGNEEIIDFVNDIITPKTKKRIKKLLIEKMIEKANKNFTEAYCKMYEFRDAVNNLSNNKEMLNKIAVLLRNEKMIAESVYYYNDNLFIPRALMKEMRDYNLRELLTSKEIEEELTKEMAIKFKGTEKRYMFEKDGQKYYTLNGFEFYEIETGKTVKDEGLIKELEAAHDYYV